VAVVGGFIPLVAKAAGDVQAGGIRGLQNTVPALIGYSPANRRFTGAYLSQGLYPIMIGFAIHKIASMFGVNRALASARVPFIRI
jgi:hypothetical protein